jgi:hypothetical protein
MLDQLSGTKLLLGTWPGVLTGLGLVGLFLWILARPAPEGKVPESLPDWVPGLWNAYQFVFHNMGFMKYAR